MIPQTFLILTLVKTHTLCDENQRRFSDYDYYYDPSNDVLDDRGRYPEYYDNYGRGFNDTLRTNRRNEYIPFNSLTLGEGDSSASKLSSKFKSKIKDKIKNKNKVEWWTKKKKNKKKSQKEKSKPKTSSTTVRTTTATTATTEKLTTWFPNRKQTTSSYFSRPLDYQKPLRPVSQEASKVFLDKLVNESSFIKEKIKLDKKRLKLPTLTEVSGLFEEFFYFAQHYYWIKDNDRVKEIFMKILEKFSARDVNIDDTKQVRNFLQKEIFTISNSVNEPSIDSEIYNRYNFIVSDLIKRKLDKTQVRNPIITTTTRKPFLIKQVTKKPVINYLNGKIKKTVTLKPHSWKPDKTPNSPHRSKPPPPQFYPQNSAWLLELQESLAPNHNDFSGPTQSIEQSSLIDSGYLGVGSGNMMPPTMKKTSPIQSYSPSSHRIVKELGLNSEHFNISNRRVTVEEPMEKLMSPFLVEDVHSTRGGDQSLNLSPFLVQNYMKLDEMKKLMEIFIQSDFQPLGLNNKADNRKPGLNYQTKFPSKKPRPVTTSRPSITTYRPVPEYIRTTESTVDIADIIADLIVEQIEKTSDKDGKSKNKRFLDLLAALTDLEDDRSLPPPTPTLPPRPPPTPPPTLPPGPPYLPPNSLPVNSLTRPPYLFPTVSPPEPPKRINQNFFQTDFNKQNLQSGFQETRPIKPFIKKQKFDSMIKNLLSNEIDSVYADNIKPQSRPKRPPSFNPYPKPFETRVPVPTIPVRKPVKKKESSFITRYPIKPAKKKETPSFPRYPAPEKPAKKKESTAFSRYPIKIPEIKQNQHFSLPIDSLANFNSRKKVEDLNGRNSPIDEDDFVSFSDQLRLMLEEIGSRTP